MPGEEMRSAVKLLPWLSSVPSVMSQVAEICLAPVSDSAPAGLSFEMGGVLVQSGDLQKDKLVSVLPLTYLQKACLMSLVADSVDPLPSCCDFRI